VNGGEIASSTAGGGPDWSGLGRVGLFMAELAVVVQDHVDGDIIGKLGHATERADRNSNTGHLGPWSCMNYSNRVNDPKMPPS
jgi:hypothetical protein